MKQDTVLRMLAGLAVAITFTVQPALSQRPGPTGGGGGTPGGAGGATTGGGTRTPTTTPTPTPDRGNLPKDRNPSPFGEQQNRPIFLSGRVQLDDGTAPPEPLVIERLCNGVARAEGYTDSKGRFSFQLGQNSSITQDASYSSVNDMSANPTQGLNRGTIDPTGSQRNGVSERELMGCELRASLPGYRSDVVNLSGRRMFDHPEVGTIVLHRLANVEGTTISTTSLAAPKDARKALEKAREALKKNKVAEGQKHLEKAVELYPQYAAAWFELGRVHESLNNPAEARKCYAQALAADGKFVNPYLQLAQMASREKNWQEVVETTNRITKLDPFDFPQAYFYNSVANYNLGKFDAAEVSAREAQKLDTGKRIPKVHHVLGAILAEKKDYTGAAEQMRNYLTCSPNAPDVALVKTQLAELEKLSGDAKAKADTPQQ
jgi:tetratricopeptide (TPR) repeat protein